jgi:CRISPR system Cascade subunit CasD
MKSVLLRLEGPLQAWGTQGRFSIRDTDAEPSKSGVIGLVGAALGMSRDDDVQLAALSQLRMAVRVDREGAPLNDYHTAGGGRFRGESYGVSGADGTVLTDRHYLIDASFLVALGGDDHELVDRVAAALQDPVWPLFLGRKACVPSRPVFSGTFPGTPEDAVRETDDHDVEAVDAKPMTGKLRFVFETDPDSPGARPRSDVPLSFKLYERTHGRRFVRIEWSDRAIQSGDRA